MQHCKMELITILQLSKLVIKITKQYQNKNKYNNNDGNKTNEKINKIIITIIKKMKKIKNK